MRSNKRRPGRTGMRTRSNETRDRKLLARSQDPSLLVDLPSDPNRAFAEIIFRQLARFLTKSQVLVLIDASADDAQQLADQRGEPVASVDAVGRVLAFRTPQ